MNGIERKYLKVSIVISTRNRAYVISRAITSALKQGYDNFEIIVADDASTDNTQDVVRDFMKCDNRIKYFKQEERLGIAPTWKKAFFEYSSGDLITVLNDDDEFIDDYFLSKVGEKFLDTTIGCVFTNIKLNYQQYEISKNAYKIKEGIYTPDQSLFLGFFSDNGAVFRKALLRKLNLFSVKNYTLDIELMYKVATLSNIYYLDIISYSHNFHANNLTNLSFSSTFRYAGEWIDSVYDFIESHNVLEKNRLEEWLHQKNYNLWNYLLLQIEYDIFKLLDKLSKYENHKNFVIYGCGENGKILYNFLANKNKNIILVDDEPIGYFCNQKVNSLKEYQENNSFYSDFIIIIASTNPNNIIKMRMALSRISIEQKIIDILMED